MNARTSDDTIVARAFALCIPPPYDVTMTTRASAHFSHAERATLAALAQCILNDAPPSDETIEALVARCEARIAPLPPHRRALVAQAIRVLGSRVATFIALKRATPFVQLSPDAQTRCFHAHAMSSLAPLRSAHQAVRKLVLAVNYAHPVVTAAIGYAGPLQSRDVQAPWEGPLPGEPLDSEPVARGHMQLPRALAHEPAPPNVLTAATISHDTHVSADVVVIGTGAGGAVAACRLADAGFRVVMLERGSYLTRADFTENEGALNEQLYADGALRTTDDGAFALVQGQAVGGSSLVNWMIMLRTPDHVLHEWAQHAGVYGMSPSEIAPVFDRIESEVHARVVPDDAHSPNNRLLLDGARALGWHATSAVINASKCVRCGFCGLGCRHNAKQSVLLTFIPRALAAGATLYADSQVTRVEQRERDGGSGTPPIKRVHAQMHGRDGSPPRALTIDAPLVVVSGGAIETPALLQRSGFGGGGVGQWLRLHPTTALIGVYDHDILVNTGIPLSSVCDEFSRWNDSDYGFWMHCPPMHPSFASAALPGFGADHAAMMRNFRKLGVIVALTRDGADRAKPNGSVSIDKRGRISIEYALGVEERRRVRAAQHAAAQLHFANGAREVVSMHASPVRMRSTKDLPALASASLDANRIAMFSAHVNGTCRMGTDPESSGTTPDGERHGVRGLYIADGSLLPTSLGVNPQETIMAVASVIAERMATRHAGIQRG